MTHPAIATLAELRSSGHVHRSVKTEIRNNLISRLASGEPSLPGIVGFDDTVVPEVERALLAGHDIVLLGERGQGKTRLIRTLIGLLDEWTPVVEGSEINDHPYAPQKIKHHGTIALPSMDNYCTPSILVFQSFWKLEFYLICTHFVNFDLIIIIDFTKTPSQKLSNVYKPRTKLKIHNEKL